MVSILVMYVKSVVEFYVNLKRFHLQISQPFFQASHARLMISLPGFTVSPAEEVKSRNFAFKVYHTGTTFYFAAESGEDLAGWVDSFSKVTVSEEEQSQWYIQIAETSCCSVFHSILYIASRCHERNRWRRRRKPNRCKKG